LNGTANKAAVKWCGPYSQANSLGWYLWSPTDIDIIWKGGTSFEYRHVSEYSDYDYHFVRNLVKPHDGVDPNHWCPKGGRTKFTWGVADEGVVQIWTGCIFQTPPNWCLHIRSPINCELPHRFHQKGPICSVQEGILETDWMQYDIWINLKFHVENKYIYLRRNSFPPLAQLVPIHRSSLEGWKLTEHAVNRDTPEGEKVFKYWIDYNRKKYELGGKQQASAHYPEIMKDSTTFHRERKAALSRCPFLASLEHSIETTTGDDVTPDKRHEAASSRVDIEYQINTMIPQNCPQHAIVFQDHKSSKPSTLSEMESCEVKKP
jgi:hypothetical protein